MAPNGRRAGGCILAMIVGLSAPSAAASDPGTLEVPVAADAATVERQISSHLVLRVSRWPNQDGTVAGWEVAVEDERHPGRGNLLYHSRLWHGPYPTQVTASSLQAGLFPAERRLPVRGRRWQVDIACVGCTTAGEGDSARLTGGTLRVSWHRR